jgi:mannose-6-phosphate isomerase-like protein (cupin superfamily)
MAVILDGGCRVSTMREGEPSLAGTLRVWNQIGRSTGAQAISLRVLEFSPGLSPGFRNAKCDDVLYMLEDLDSSGNSKPCIVFIDGRAYEVGPQTGIYLRPGQTFTVSNPESSAALFVSAQCPEPAFPGEIGASLIKPLHDAATETHPIVSLHYRRAVPTGDRWYRVLVDEQLGSTQVTQFVGSIPPGRAPDHFHDYEEVLFILRGVGRMWAGDTSTPIAPGSCIYLPKGQAHCVENTGDNELRLLGVFYPAGSPAVRYET